MIALNIYTGFEKQKADRDVRLQMTTRQVDSLRAVQRQLDQELSVMRTSLNRYPASSQTIDAGSATMAKSQ
ncbi:hypothetical protein GCM10023189_39800 [Nibrella saemangeumensis]|uniref:Uncharacterized protein n=2 Tax=Nibrella saemangeumensis TaxID=1084526 RepID=A0ABP8N9H8_9BACT